MRPDSVSTSLTEGSIISALFIFALPLLAGSLFQQLYNTADYMFVGNLVGKNAAAAVGASSILVTCLIGLFTGISVGAGVAIAQCVGANDKERVKLLSHTALTFSMLLGIVMTIAGEAAAEWILRILHTPESIILEALTYIRLYFLGMIPMVVYNVGSGILRACGDSRSPFYILAVGGILNVFVDWLMIGFFHMGVRGAAIATTVSQSFSALGVLYYLFKGNTCLKLSWKSLQIEKSSLRMILIFGLPAGIQTMVITLSNMVVQYHINSFGADSIAAFSTYFKLENFTYMPVVAFGQAMMTFVGQNYGAGKKERIKKGVRTGALVSSGIVAVLAFVLLVFGHTTVGWFVKDEAVVAIGIRIISVSFPFYWMNSLIEIYGGAIRGFGKTFLSMLMILLTLCGFRVMILAIVDNRFHDIRYLTAAYPLSWAAAVICLYVSYRFLITRLFK